MRPVNKGESPYEVISKYTEALPHLENAIGPYCSYCEFRISHVPEVEHVASKSRGGALTAWENLLLGCKYCNARKNAQVTPENVDDYMWPDQDNTALAYSYTGGIPTVNASVLNAVDPTGTKLAKAQKLFDLVKLANVPTPRQKDKRFHERNRAYELALESLGNWQKAKASTPEMMDVVKQQISYTARENGFFSVWMTVFADEPIMLNALINVFPGTNKAYFDEAGHPKFV